MQIREKGEIPLLGRVSVFILNSECFLIVEHRPLGRKRIIKAVTAVKDGRVLWVGTEMRVFPLFDSMVTDGQTDGWTDGWTDGQSLL